MIFSPELAAKVMGDGKTVTRRRLLHRDRKPIRYEPGRVYAVQPGRGQRHIGHICVYAVHQERLREISVFEAQREGFRHVSDFMAYWMRLHGGWNPDEMVAVIDFMRADDCPRCPKE